MLAMSVVALFVLDLHIGESVNFLAFALLHNRSGHFSAIHQRGTDFRLISANKKDFAKSDFVAHFAIMSLEDYGFFFLNAVLFAARANHCVHRI